MSKSRSDSLFLLVKSMRKSEKRYFKLDSSEASGDHKYMKLFDLLDKQQEFDEDRILQTNGWIKKSQFSNLKAHLYKKILQSLKRYAQSSNEDINVRENIDYVQLLYDRSLYGQSMSLLQKLKKTIVKSDNLELYLEILKWEKNLLPYTIDRHNQKRVSQIVEEANQVNERISRTNTLTNLAVELNAIYLRNGFIKNKTDYLNITQTFKQRLPTWNEDNLSFREKLLWYNIQLSYYGYLQDYEKSLLYANKWVELFETIPNNSYLFEMYLKGLNHQLNAQARLNLFNEFDQTHKKLRSLSSHHLVELNENIQIRLFKYSYAHQFNGYFIKGDFSTGVHMLRKIENRLEGFIEFLDKHSELILYYKIACLYFGNDDFGDALKWLNRIINSEYQDIREDVLSFARILNLIVHYELGNQDVIEYYIKSTYRYLLKKEDLHLFQQYILEFIKGLSKDTTQKELMSNFKSLRKKLIELEQSKYDKRAFVYFDIISWLDSKISGRTVQSVIREKAMAYKKP